MISGSTKRDSLTPFFCMSGVSVPPFEHLRRERAFHVHEVELAVLEGEQPRLVLLHDADLDAADLRHLLALHLGHDARVVGIGARP